MDLKKVLNKGEKMKIPDIMITYEPADDEVNRICGHTFEAFDLYLFLKEYLPNQNIKILFMDRLKTNLLKNAFEDKYSIKFDKIKNDIIINRNQKKKYAKIIIYTSGIGEYHYWQFISKYFISFRCNSKLKFINKENVYYFLDKRIYKNFDFEFPKNTFHSIKKFNFKYYKKFQKSDNKKLIYLNSKLRNIDINYYKNKFENILFVSGGKYNHPDVLEAPIKNLFEKFDTYIYTPIARQFDCSPRLLTESYYYNKKIIFDFDFKKYAGPNYGDIGLYWRWYDIQNNFNKLIYNENDELLQFLKEII